MDNEPMNERVADDSELSFLLAEGSARDALLVLTYLAEEQGENALAVDQSSTEEETVARLTRKDYDLVFLGSIEGDVLSILRRIRSRETPPPVLLLVDRADPELTRQARDAGATDLLVKSSLRRSTLSAAVRYVAQLRDLRVKKDRAESGLRRSISAKNRAEEALRESNEERAQAEALRDGQSRILEMIAAGAPLPEVLARLALFIESHSAGMLCSILLLDDSGTRLLHGAAPSLPAEYTRAVDGVAIGPRTGSCGTAAFTGKPVIVADIGSDPLWADFRQLAAPHGLRACWSTPILSRQGKVLGTFAMYYREPRSPTGAETRLIDIATQIAGIAIERQRSEHALRESEEKYRSMIESSDDAIIATGLDGAITSWNSGAERIYGYTSGEIQGLPVSVLIPGERGAELEANFGRVRAGTNVPHYDTIRRRKDGTRIDVAVTISPIRNGRGDVVGAASITRDITERKRAMAERQQLEEQLRQAQKLEAIGKLAGGIAHDFNNILTAILGYSDVALAELPPEAEALRANVGEIKKAGERAATLTRQLLAYSRKQILEPRVIDVSSVVRNVERMLRRLIGEDIDLVITLAAAVGSVSADPGQLEQVILNLALNARDAMPQGGRLTIETSAVELDEAYARANPGAQPGAYVLLAMTDTGGGMDAHAQAHVFEPFFTTKDKGKGTGLGLATGYGIVKQSGGYIDFESRLGEGTTFRIYLPRVDRDPEDDAERPAAKAARGTETILLAEDEEAIRHLAQRILQASGYRVIAASGGGEALELARRHDGPVHLLLTDVVMKGMSGRDLARFLGEVRPITKILYMSGHTEDAIVHHGVLYRGTNFLQKPFAPDVLAQKVRDVLDSPRAASGMSIAVADAGSES